MRLCTMRFGAPANAACEFPARLDEFPVLAKKFPASGVEQGIGCKLLNPPGDRLPKPPQEAGIGRNFRKVPAKFPAIREFGGPPP